MHPVLPLLPMGNIRLILKPDNFYNMPLKLSKPLILASQSPRRVQLMRESGFEFEVLPAEVEERIDPDWEIHEIAEKLAILKAEAILERQRSTETIILAADTIVILENQILGKPESHEEACMMVRSLSGIKHIVNTGVAIRGAFNEQFTVSTEVFIDNLSEKEVLFYIDQYKPFDKAGAYGVQEWIGHCKIKYLKGSFTNVMGLPMHEVYSALQPFIRYE